MQIWSLWLVLVARPAEAVGQWLATWLQDGIPSSKNMKLAAFALLQLILWTIAMACSVAHLPDRLWACQADSGPPQVECAPYRAPL